MERIYIPEYLRLVSLKAQPQKGTQAKVVYQNSDPRKQDEEAGYWSAS